MKKKGFTLIELLAVIVILAIIALIVIPVIGDMIESSSKAAYRESVNGILDSSKNYIGEYILEHKNDDIEYPHVFTCDGVSCKDSNNYALTFKGNVPISGTITLYQDGSMTATYISNGTYCASGMKGNLQVAKGCSEIDITEPTLVASLSGKKINMTLTDNESGIDSYCISNVNSYAECVWITTNTNVVEYTLTGPGTYYVFTKDKKGNVSDYVEIVAPTNAFCPYTANQVVGTYSYTGGVQTFTVPDGCDGTYKLEVWGAQGGNASGYSGGYGGYAKGTISLTRNQIIYIIVGSQGASNISSSGSGGYNGGGNGSSVGSIGNTVYRTGAGGGATHIAIENRGVLSNYNSYRNEILIVAGGGGGANYDSGSSHMCGNGGTGGGTNGGNGGNTQASSTGGSQTTAGSYAGFGYGGTRSGGIFPGGGGGWFGGGVSAHDNTPSAGGSGYIGGVTDGSMSNGVQSGNGKAQITFISLN